MSNRLLDIFHTERRRVNSETRDPAPAKRPSKAPRHVSRVATKGDASVNTRFKGVETRLERENRRLREQLKFQSAVLDRLAGDVHILEYKAASANNSEGPSSTERDEERKSSASVATEDCNSYPAETRQSLGVINQNSFGRGDSVRLRFEIKKARDDAAKLRKELALSRRAAEESKDTHIDLLSRERKFRAAVEAGLREKVQNIRHRARDREGRLSTAFSAAKAQLQEAMDLLANKEEEANLARSHMAELEEKAAVAVAKLIERDHQARWFERRLAEVSSSEAEAMGLRLEEMSTSLVNQQKELERLRALTKECTGPSDTLQRRGRNESSPRHTCCQDRDTQTERERTTSGSRDDRTPFIERATRSITDGKFGLWRQKCPGPDARDSDVLPSSHLNASGNSDIGNQEFDAMDKFVEWLLSPADQASRIPIALGVESACICKEDSLKLLRSRISGALAVRASIGALGDSVGRGEVVSTGRVPALVEELTGIDSAMHEENMNEKNGKHRKSGAMSPKMAEKIQGLSQERTVQGELEKGPESSADEATTAERLDVTRGACVTPSKGKEGSPTTCYRLRERNDIDFEQEPGNRCGEGAIRAERDAEKELCALKISLGQSMEHAAKLKDQLYAAQTRYTRTQEESRQAVQRSESRVLELEQAWEALAAKVMSLANRNADLEWAILALRKDGHAMIPSCTREPAASVVPAHEAVEGDRGDVMDGRRPNVPRATLDLDSLIEGNANDEGDEAGEAVMKEASRDMPVENVGQPVVLRTNEEARKALVKSKDGRVKWLTVSADPAEPSWEECVRSWARKLGVCAQSSPSTPDTPLATPPPDGPGKHWPCRETVDDPTTAAPDVQWSTVEQNISRKEATQSKRTGSSPFARGFLLGLGGVGGSSSSSSIYKSPGKVEVDLDDTIAAPHSTLPEIQTVMEEGVEASTCGRDRWVKCFKGAPSSPTNSSTDGNTSIDASKSSSDGPCLSKSDCQSTEAWLETVHWSNNNGDSSMASKGKKKKNKSGKSKGKCGNARANKSSAPKGNKSTQVDSSTSGSTKQGRGKSTLNVTFDSVTLIEFTRDVGGCTVPSDGTWALSLGLPFRETRVDVDGYEASKAEILLERASKLSKKQRNLATGETRQFDHRPVGERNPLFGRLEEKERSKRLLDYACFHKSDHEEAYRDNHHIEDLGGPLHKVSYSDFVDRSQEAAAELVALRKSRRVSQGCSCACLRADKLNVAKLRGELGKRGLKASGSKKDLTKMLQDAMRQESEEKGAEGHKVCRSDDCQCVRDGVDCHADQCNCCKGPNIGKKDAHHGGNCGNPMGVYAYNSNIVRVYREPYVTAKSVSVQERWHVRSNSIGSGSEHH